MRLRLRKINVRGATRELHLSRDARKRYSVAEELFGVRGTIVFADAAAASRLAQRMNEIRDARRYPELAVRAGDLFAAGLIHEMQHLLLASLRTGGEADPVRRLLKRAQEELGSQGVDELFSTFTGTYPTIAVERGDTTVEDYLAGETDGMANREVVLEELLLLWVANRNPALERFQELFDDAPLKQAPYLELQRIARNEATSREQGEETSQPGSVLALLEGPILASPTSLAGQLEYIREVWRPLLGEEIESVIDKLLLSADLLAEERKEGFSGPAPAAPLLTVADLPGPAEATDPGAEQFSPDASWMPSVVLIAKSTYVWLDQLSRRFERPIESLDAIPDEELDELAERGFNGLWLIGLWERSQASRRIKHLRGQPDAVASAYALYDYQIAEDLGGEAAYRNLQERAWQRGIRLASDMVPNHVGIDGRWVVEHPDWFVQLDHAPYPGYSFNGPDLSTDERVGVFLEDHYYDNSDAAVVFKRLDRTTGEERYLYHGNDGTAMPWNDTAQLDYLKPEVREAVIRTIIEVARRFPIIRFDAAMTLAKQHIQRLWYPEPGQGGAIPSRALYGSMSAEEFEQRIPTEFWREVVDRVAREVPETLLLAEAFWMMEGYFVRTLGMHRVYNSAFMNMLQREANAEFRQLVKNVLEFDREVLGRFVNFMNNPDEDTAIAQFGKGDKYFGVCTVLATMPGLPMFGHGQIEGFEEKYGMEFRRARRDEMADPWLVERHQREIFPLLHRRNQFAGVDGFLLYDFLLDDGSVAEDVLAYSNRTDGKASLVLFHNSYAEVSGRIHLSAPFRSGDESSGGKRLFEGLGLEGGPGRYLVFREHGTGLEHLVESQDVRERGLEVDLDAFRYRVLLDFREVRDSAAEPYGELCRELSGRGVASVHDAVVDRRLRALFDVFGDLLDTPLDETEALQGAFADFVNALAEHGLHWSEADGRSRAVQRFEELLEAYEAHLGIDAEIDSRLRSLETGLLAWIAMVAVGEPVYGRFRLDQELAAGEHSLEGPYEAILFAELVPLLLDYAGGHDSELEPTATAEPPERSAEQPPEQRKERSSQLPAARAAKESAADLLAELLADERVKEFLRPNSDDGRETFDGDAFRVLTDGVVLARSLRRLARHGVSQGLAGLLKELRRLEEASGYRTGRLKAALRAGSAPVPGRPSGERSDE